jgi:hypothetical protein
MKANRGRAVVGEPELEPIPAPDVIAADPAALAEWDALAEGLRRLGVLTRESVGLLAAYCLAWSDVKKARAAILKAGPDADALVETNKGGTRRRTCYNIVRERTADACRCLVKAEAGREGAADRERFAVAGADVQAGAELRTPHVRARTLDAVAQSTRQKAPGVRGLDCGA